MRDRLSAHGLAARSVTMVFAPLAQILDEAVDHGLQEQPGPRAAAQAAPAVRPTLVSRSVGGRAATRLSRQLGGRAARYQRFGCRPPIALLALSGPRIAEALTSERRQLDLRAGVIALDGSKTAAGKDRRLELSARLLDELRGHLASDAGRRGRWLFATGPGDPLGAANVRRMLRGAVKRARAEGRIDPPAITPHSLRRTFASLCSWAGKDLRWTMGRLGHVDPKMTLAVYAQAVQRERSDRKLARQLMAAPDDETGSFETRFETTAESEGSG